MSLRGNKSCDASEALYNGRLHSSTRRSPEAVLLKRFILHHTLGQTYQLRSKLNKTGAVPLIRYNTGQGVFRREASLDGDEFDVSAILLGYRSLTSLPFFGAENESFLLDALMVSRMRSFFLPRFRSLSCFLGSVKVRFPVLESKFVLRIL